MAACADTSGRFPRWFEAIRVQAGLVAVASSLVLLTNLGSAPLWDDDETKNTSCSLAMLAHDDWVVPRFNETLRTDKPPLVNWLQMAGFALAGRDETGARMPSAVLTVASSLLVAALASRLFPALPAVGLWSGLAMGTCIWSGIAGRAATPDASLCFFTTLALSIFAMAWIPRDGGGGSRASLANATAAGLAIGGALLAKGPVGYVLPMAAFGLFAWWQSMADLGRPTQQSRVRWMANAAVTAWHRVRPLVITAAAVSVAGPWYALVTERTRGGWLYGFLFTHNVGRFSAPMEGHDAPVFFYGIVLVIGLFPWSIVAAVTTVDLARGLRGGPDAGALRLLACWTAVWIGCFSLSGTKLPGYVWPAYPAAAIAVGWFLERWRLGLAESSARWMPLAWASLAAAGAALFVVAPSLGDRLGAAGPFLAAIGLVPLAAAAAAWWCSETLSSGDPSVRTRGRDAALACLAIAACLTVGGAVAYGPHLVGRSTGVRPLLAAIGTDAARERWASYRCHVPSLVFYSRSVDRRQWVPRLAHPGQATEFFGECPDALVVTPSACVQELLGVAPPGHAILARSKSLSGHRELALVGPTRLARHPSVAARHVSSLPGSQTEDLEMTHERRPRCGPPCGPEIRETGPPR